MSRGRTIIFEEEQTEFADVSKRLITETYAKAVFVVDVDGQLISQVGETAGIDTTGLASLVAGSTAATGGLAKMLGEEEFPVHFHEGRLNHLHVSLIQESIPLTGQTCLRRHGENSRQGRGERPTGEPGNHGSVR
jgi:hypothetical protein